MHRIVYSPTSRYTSCKGCKERHDNCHATCQSYLEAVERGKREREAKRRENEITRDWNAVMSKKK